NIFTLLTKHSDTPIYKILERITGVEFIEVEESSNAVICHSCFLKIDEYDMALKTVQKIENEFMFFLNRPNTDKDTEIIVEMIKEEHDIAHVCLQENIFLDKSMVKAEERPTQHLRNRNERIEPKRLGNSRKLLKTVEVVEDTTQNVKKNNEDISRVKEHKPQFVENYTLIDGVLEECSEPVYTISKTNHEHLIRPRTRGEELLSNAMQVTRDSNLKILPQKARKLFNKKPPHPIKCSKCSKDFLSRSEYKLHVKTHEDDLKVICYICGATYKSKSALAIHMGVHNGVTPFECPICKKFFTQKGALVRHMPIHTGEKPYQCEKCGKQFIHYSSFHMHQLSHDDIRTKKCPICGLKLRSNSHLNRHMRVHSGEKPYACPTCGQKFAQRYKRF
uniref:C2H2-type domain-containing protein n=1 Tax=Phlebotomus papatasi TaxID=29031 RepID=A0A1B0DP72_PHLPP